MKVLIIHNQLWTHYKAKLFSEIFAQFPKHDNELLVAQIGLYESSRKSFGDLDYSIHQYPYKLLFDKALEEISFGDRLKALSKLLIEYKPTLVNFTGYYDIATWPLILYCKLSGIKIVLSNESTAQDQKRSFIKEVIKKWIVNFFDSFFCFGTKSAHYLTTLGVDPAKISVVKAAVVDNQFIEDAYKKALVSFRQSTKEALKLRPLNFIYVGRFVSVKNLDLLLNAFDKLKDPLWGLILIGDGECKTGLEKMILEKNIEGITILPSQKWNEIPRFLTLGDIFVLPSFSETWGLVINEAMVCGLPVIVSDQCGCASDLVENKATGKVFKSNDEDDLWAKMVTLKADNIEDYSINAQKLISDYSPKNVALEMITAFANLEKK
jgi:glycosyltransferase involved in cell wall biosynthesis